jgi:hypothetical protein
MNESEKIKFVSELSANIAVEIIQHIKGGRIPEEWDGVELRWLFEEMAVSNFGRQDRSRKRAYNNIVIVNNL